MDAHLMKYFQEPLHVGEITGSDVAQGTTGAIALGRVLQLSIRIDEHRYISEVKFKAYGCGFTLAVAEWLCGWLQGKSISQAQALDRMAIAQALNLPSSRIYAAVLAEDTLKTVLHHFLKEV